jgi:hypothetical protein
MVSQLYCSWLGEVHGIGLPGRRPTVFTSLKFPAGKRLNSPGEAQETLRMSYGTRMTQLIFESLTVGVVTF